ncbi:MFS transporter [Nocardia sp. NPDC088792]|uniref:MFS transporter n=1 Tax=Nocardia sp. NPDC088792 TaxID=3364332 RepID=UPI003803E6D0
MAFRKGSAGLAMLGAAPVERRLISTIVIMGAFWATMAGTTIPTPLYPLYERAFGFGALAVTVIFGVYALAVVAGLLSLGGLSDRLGRRPIVAVALALAVLATVVFLLAGNLAELLVGRVLSGLAAALMTGAATAQLAELAAPGGHTRAGRLALGANMGGLASGPLLAGLLGEYAPWPLRSSWWVIGALLLLALAALAVVPETLHARRAVPIRLPESSEPVGTAEQAGSAAVAMGPAGGTVATRNPGPMTRPRVPAETGSADRAVVPRNPGSGRRPSVPAEIRGPFWRAALLAGSGFAVLGVLTAVTGLFLAEVAHIHSLLATASIVTVAFVCIGLGQLLEKRVERVASLVSGAGLLVGAGLIAMAMATATYPPLLCAAVSTGLATGIAIGHGITLINTRTPAAGRGGTVSAFFAVLYIMLALPAIGVGALIGPLGLRTAGTVFAAVVAILVVTVVATARPQVRVH